MIANIAAVVLILALTFVAVYSIIKSYRKAKVTGNPSCVGCCSCNHSEGVCPRFNNINFDKKKSVADEARRMLKRKNVVCTR